MSARRKSGFTLIELLVVIAIIAILAAILFPVFARAREAARKSTCQSNMKECAIALQTYWNDYDATLPSSVPAGSTVGTTGPGNDGGAKTGFDLFCRGVGVMPPGTSTDPFPAYPRTWAQMLYSAMKSKDIMFCPSDSAEHNPPNASAYDPDVAAVSYWWKYAIDRAWRNGAMKCQKESDFGYNADQIVFYECAGFHTGSSQGVRNGVQINVAYLDSHVRSVSITNCSVDTDATPVKTTIAQGEPWYFNFKAEEEKKKDVNPPASNVATTLDDPRIHSDSLP